MPKAQIGRFLKHVGELHHLPPDVLDGRDVLADVLQLCQLLLDHHQLCLQHRYLLLHVIQHFLPNIFIEMKRQKVWLKISARYLQRPLFLGKKKNKIGKPELSS